MYVQILIPSLLMVFLSWDKWVCYFIMVLVYCHAWICDGVHFKIQFAWPRLSGPSLQAAPTRTQLPAAPARAGAGLRWAIQRAHDHFKSSRKFDIPKFDLAVLSNRRRWFILLFFSLPLWHPQVAIYHFVSFSLTVLLSALSFVLIQFEQCFFLHIR